MPLRMIILAGLLVLACGCSPLAKANSRFQSQQYAASIPLYSQYLRISPDNVQARARLGYALLRAGKLDQAAAELEKVLQLDPSNGFAALYLGMAYLKAKSCPQAIEVWRTYDDSSMPLVTAEVKKQLTLLRIYSARRRAEKLLERGQPADAADLTPGTVAVAAFKPFTDEAYFDPLKKALQAVLIDRLETLPAARVVDRIRLQALLEAMHPGADGVVSPENAPRAGALLRTANVAVGGLYPGLQATPTVVAAPSGEIEASFSIRRPQDQFARLAGDVALRIAEAAGLEPSQQEKQGLVPETTDFQAVLAFGKGLDALDRGEWLAARKHFARAHQREPDCRLFARWLEAAPASAGPDETIAPDNIASAVEAAVRKQLKSRDKPSLYDVRSVKE
jgi:tetratricopeptide (TPR) repeat protein